MTESFKQETLALVDQIKRYLLKQKKGGQDVVVFNQPISTKESSKPIKKSTINNSNPVQPKPALPSAKSELEDLVDKVNHCKKCDIANSRKQAVFGQGNQRARLVFVGEAPGADEDKQGQPFVGAAGKLLTKIIESIGLKREDVYICNVLKCRPTGNRNPSNEEIANCRSYLEQQLEIIQPDIICALGTFAAQTLLNTSEPISRLRGKRHSYNDYTVIPTFHPAALLYHPQNKRLVWEDMKMIAKQLNLPLSKG